MKRIINLVITIIFTGILTISCSEEFLEKEPKGVAGGSVMSSEVGLENLLIGAYNRLHGYYLSGPSMWELGSMQADDGYKGEVAGHPVYDIELQTWEVNTNNRVASETWRSKYDGISRCNDVLNFLKINQEGDKPISETRAKLMEAEVKFLRAYFHFYLTKVFDKIPYIKTIDEMDGMKPEEVINDTEGWEGIESDLQYAIDNLTTDHPLGQVGRPTKYAAMAMKAHAHLFQQEFGEAKSLLDEIINSGKFQLVDHYVKNYLSTTENNEESIFEIQGNIRETGEGNNAMMVQGPTMLQKGPAGFGWGYASPSQSLFEAFQVTEEGLPVLDSEDRIRIKHDYGIFSTEEFIPTDHPLDPRVDWTIARRGIPYWDWGVFEGHSWIREQGEGHYALKKWMHYSWEDALPSDSKNARNFRAYRYAHVLLWRAEVAVEDGELDYARQLVNMVRARAQASPHMGKCETYIFDGREIVVNENEPSANYMANPYPPGSTSFSSKEEARKAVRIEQRLEFGTEGMRFFDLRRWGEDEHKLNYFVQSDGDFCKDMRGKTYNADLDDYLPIPEDQVDLQEGVITQDPAYQ